MPGRLGFEPLDSGSAQSLERASTDPASMKQLQHEHSVGAAAAEGAARSRASCAAPSTSSSVYPVRRRRRSGLLYLRLAAGPLSFGRLPERVADACRGAGSVPAGPSTLRNTAIELEEGSPALRATGLDIRNPGRRPGAAGALCDRQRRRLLLLAGDPAAPLHRVPGPAAARLVNRDGSLTFAPEPARGGPRGPRPAATPEPAASRSRAGSVRRPVSGVGRLAVRFRGRAEAALSAPSTRPQLTNARLTLVDADRRSARPSAAWTPPSTRSQGRRAALRRHPRRPSGRVAAARRARKADGRGGYRATLERDRAPVQDLLLLAGLRPCRRRPISSSPVGSMRPFAGRARAELTARLDSSAGIIRSTTRILALRVERVEHRGRLGRGRPGARPEPLEFRGGGNDVRLQGELLAQTGARALASVLCGGRTRRLAGLGPGRIRPCRSTTSPRRLVRPGRGGIRYPRPARPGPHRSTSAAPSARQPIRAASVSTCRAAGPHASRPAHLARGRRAAGAALPGRAT